MLLILTGHGKGKTTSAIGQSIRVLGSGGRVFFIQFIKSHNFPAGEDKILSSLGKNFHYEKGGLGFVGILGDTTPFAEHQKKAEATLKKGIEAVLSGLYRLVVFDEINVALKLGLVKEDKILAMLKNLPLNVDILLTGRDAPDSLIKIADLVTVCDEIKHPFSEGVVGKKGREY